MSAARLTGAQAWALRDAVTRGSAHRSRQGSEGHHPATLASLVGRGLLAETYQPGLMPYWVATDAGTAAYAAHAAATASIPSPPWCWLRAAARRSPLPPSLPQPRPYR